MKRRAPGSWIAGVIVLALAELSCQWLLARSLIVGPIVHLVRQILPQ